MSSEQVREALASVCGYHDGPDCQHCADTYAHAQLRQGMSDAQILADIELYRTDVTAWEAKFRARRPPTAPDSPLRPSGSLPDHQNTHPAARAGIEALVCDCYPGGFSPETYEGPQRDCPVHGEPAAVAAAVAAAVLRWAGDEYARDGARLAGLSEHAAAAGQYVAAAKAETWANEIEGARRG